MTSTDKFKKWALGYSGCDGGDPGSQDRRAIWVCGIEWGGGHSADELAQIVETNVETPPVGYEDWKHNLAFRFNWQAMKLLCAIHGGKVSDYKKFAEDIKPFTVGSSGYFKTNLYPIAFKNTNQIHWTTEFSGVTGFQNKADYVNWCKDKRFPQMRQWASEHKPKLIICLGKSYGPDFGKAFMDEGSSLQTKTIDDRSLSWGLNNDGTHVVILPFMIGRYGLQRNVSIQQFGERISGILSQTDA